MTIFEEADMRPWLSIALAAILVTGCGTAAAAASAGPAASGHAKAATSGQAKAGALASKLVAEMKFPAGTKPASLRSIPKALRNEGPPGSHWAHAERLLLAPVKPAAVWAGLLAHKPFDSPGGMGTAGDSGPTGTSALLPAPEPGVTAATAAVTLEPWHNGTLIAAYGFATWLPTRTTAEHVNPGGFRSVTVVASTFVPRQGSVTRTFSSSAVISKIAAFINARPAAPELAIPCPMPATTYQATFAPKVKGGATVTVSSSGCLTDQISVNGVAQPQVWDTSGGLATLLGKLLR